ncbi:MAG: PAS domain S-box protein [Burkholderiaceae bacterium]
MNTVNVSAYEIFNANILIVDHHDANTIPLQRLLNNSGYRNVSCTDDFHGALHLHRKFHYDLILLNLQMPGINEADLIDELQKIEMGGLLPILAIANQSTDALRALPAGVRDWIRKPFDMPEVKTRIHNMLVMRFLDKKIENYNCAIDTAVQERTAELKESEARFRSLIELSSDWYWEQDRHGNFTKVSGPVLEMLGLKECFPNDARKTHRPHIGNRKRDQLDCNMAEKRPFIDFAYSRIKPDGSLQYLRVSGEPIFDATGCFSGYRGVGVDVSEQMQMEEHLSCFKRVSDDVGDAILVVDGMGQHILDANDAALRLWGYTREELLTLNFENIVSYRQSDRRLKADDKQGHIALNTVDMIHIKDKNGSMFSAEMLSRNAKRSGEKNKFVIFVHKISLPY